jgi:LTXXQ motif family protein
MQPKSGPDNLHVGVLRTISVLAAAAGLLISASTCTAAQGPHDAHHPEGQLQEAAIVQEMPQGMMGDRAMMGGMMSGMAQGRGVMGLTGNCLMLGGSNPSYAEGRIAFLKAELFITDQQKDAWDAYAAAIKKNLAGMQRMREMMMKVMQAKSPVDRLDATSPQWSRELLR